MIRISLRYLCRNGKRAPTSGNLDFLILSRFWTKLAKVWDQAGGIFIEVPDPGRNNLSGSHGVATDNPAYQSSLVELGKKLLACARDGDTEGVRSLMARGAPFTTDWLGTSPLHLAAQYGNQATADVLLRAGISRDARTKVDKTPLHVASAEGHTEIVEMLLQNGADVDARDMLRMTPLHWAVERGNISTVEMLLRHGSNTNIESKFDKTALEIASDNGRPDIFEMLQNADQFRIVTIDNGESDQSIHAPTSMADDNGMVHMSVSQQEEVATATHQIELDPVQIALNSAAETIVSGPMITQVQDSIVHQNSYNGLSLDEGIASSRQDVEAMKLLEAHGITMLPEDDHMDPLQAVTASQTLTLTEAGKLALSLSSPMVKPTVTKVVTLNSNSVRSPLSRMALPVVSSPVPQKKQPRVIKLTPEQFAALKSGKSGQIVLSGAGGRKRETITLASPQPRKVARVSSEEVEEVDMKVDLEKQELKQQLLKKLEEAENFKKELKKREEEAERLQLQLQALS